MVREAVHHATATSVAAIVSGAVEVAGFIQNHAGGRIEARSGGRIGKIVQDGLLPGPVGLAAQPIDGSTIRIATNIASALARHTVDISGAVGHQWAEARDLPVSAGRTKIVQVGGLPSIRRGHNRVDVAHAVLATAVTGSGKAIASGECGVCVVVTSVYLDPVAGTAERPPLRPRRELKGASPPEQVALRV